MPGPEHDKHAARGLLEVLPPPPAGRTGWPWDEQTDPAVYTVSSPDQWPRISVVTPSYQQGDTIEETIRSILLQNYPNFEYVIIDGGSTDQTVDVIHKYKKWLTYWVSEKDRGQSHAINKGFVHTSGDIQAYLNSDDFYCSGTFVHVGRHLLGHPDTGILHGRCVIVDENARNQRRQLARIHSLDQILDLWGVWWNRRQFVQPEVFWSRALADKVGKFREDLNFVMDYDYWVRLLIAGARVYTVNEDFTCFRITETQKSRHGDKVAEELRSLVHDLILDPATPISDTLRRSLKRAWLYDARFLGAIRDSVSRGESRMQRAVRIAGVLGRHPTILRNPHFWKRLRDVRDNPCR